MKFKALFLSALVALGLAGSARAQFYQQPSDTNNDGYAVMWLSGNFEFRRSSTDATIVTVISSTGGIQTIGIVAATAAISGLLSGAQANFSSWITASSGTFGGISATSGTFTNGVSATTGAFSGWITASSGTFQSSMTASLVNFSSAIIAGLSYNFQRTRGSAGQFLTEDGNGNLTWSSPPSGGLTTKNYDGIIVGTQNAVGVDAYVTNAAQFTLLLASFNAAGLTYSATGYGTFYFRNGLYQIAGATVPAGINIVCQSSVSFSLGNITAQTLITNYGTVGDARGSPCIIDGAGSAVNSQAFVAKSWSVSNLNFTGFQNQSANGGFGAPDQRSVFCTITSSEARGNLWFMPNGFRANASGQVTNKGGQATMVLMDALNCRFNVRTSTWVPGPDTNPLGRVFLSMKQTTNCVVNGDYEAAGNNWITLAKDNRKPTIMGRATIRTEGTSAESDSGFICFDYQQGPYASSTTYIGPLTIRAVGKAGYNMVKVASSGAGYSNTNLTLMNVQAFCEDPTNTYTFLTSGSDNLNMVIDQLFISGCQTGVVDSGTASKWNYYKDGVKFTQ